jgi:phenylalanyl-tRNA synthetase beta chain
MLVPLSWLRDFAPIELDGRALGDVFDDLGMVVEAIASVGEGLEGVVIALVKSIAPIAGADKIRRVVVDAGGPAPVEVVCGAWNFAEGDVVALATVGAVLPGGFEIAQRKMKGVVSNGMLCSAAELGLGEDAAGIMVLPAPLGASAGEPFAAAMGIVRDTVYDLAIEANRPDAMCMAGVARDAAARLHAPFAIHTPAPVPAASAAPDVSVVVRDGDLCPRFTARVLTGVSVGTSPEWMARRLSLAGMRPINSVVDASNYVMLELGQPTHPYDLDRLPGRGFVVRAAKPGETLETLDGVARRLGDGPYSDAVICDASDTAVGIAGIMGGASSEIWEGTSTVVLEAANFTPMAVARTSKRLGLRSEASHRFERGVDLEGIERAVDRFCELVALTSPALEAGPLVDVRSGVGAQRDRAPIVVRTDRVNSILGTNLGDEDIRRYLAPIGFVAAPTAPGLQEVAVPTFRPDATREIDVIEEIARHHGYSNIARTVPTTPAVGRLSAYQLERRRVRAVLTGAGLSEAVCAQLVAPGDHGRSGLPEDGIAAVEPLVVEESVLRTSLLPGMLRSVSFNSDRRNGDLAMFEIGHTFRVTDPTAELPDEREMLAVIVAGAGVDGVGQGVGGAVNALRRVETALRLASLSLVAALRPGMHPGRCADVALDGHPAGYVGEVDPEVSERWGIDGRVGWFEIDLGAVATAERRSELAAPVSRFPSSDIDLAFAVPDDIPAAAVEATLAAAAGGLLEKMSLFDVYRGPGVAEGQRSLAYRLRFCAFDRTLTDAEVGELRAACITAVESAFPARLRG